MKRDFSRIKKGIAIAVILGAGILTVGMITQARTANTVETVGTYTVKNGDTFWGIAQQELAKNDGERKYITDFQNEIVKLNPELEKNHYQVYTGQVLKIPYVKEKKGSD